MKGLLYRILDRRSVVPPQVGLFGHGRGGRRLASSNTQQAMIVLIALKIILKPFKQKHYFFKEPPILFLFQIRNRLFYNRYHILLENET